MKTVIKNVVILGMAASFLIACSAEDPAMETIAVEETDGLNQSFDIENEDLVGTWDLVSMVSDSVAVNLDLNETWSRDILTETECFKDMYFTFDLEGKVETKQAKLNFKTDKGNMICESGTYTADYELIGNQLKIIFNFNGIAYSPIRKIDVVENNGEQYLEMELTYAEARQFLSDPDYVSPTGATSVKAITMLFKKQ